MNATLRDFRWLGIGAMQRRRLGAATPFQGFNRGILTVLLLASVAPLAAQTQFRTEMNPDGTVTIFKSSTGVGVGCPTGVLTIPGTMDGRTVTRIGDKAFASCETLTDVTIPDSVASIGSEAFVVCSALTNVTIGNGVTSIGASAFLICQRLRSITIPDSVTTLGNTAFGACTELTSVTIGNGVTSIGTSAFQGCSRLTSITIPDSVTSIGERAFDQCTSLSNITIGNGVTRIGRAAFDSCPLKEVLFNKSRTMLIRYPFSTAGHYTIPGGVTSIADNAFVDSGLTSVTIPNSVNRIGSSAFIWCRSLTSVKIPDSITSIGWEAFYGCTSLTNVTIPDSVTRIGGYAFYGCTAMPSVTIPASITSIEARAFASCASLKAAYFAGDSPPAAQASIFQLHDGTPPSPTTAYYLPGTRGWTSTFSGRPTAPWVRPQPIILDFGARFGVSTNGFGFVVSWATNVPVVAEARADLPDSTWTPISTNALTDGWVQFTDPEWKSQQAKFYRVRGR